VANTFNFRIRVTGSNALYSEKDVSLTINPAAVPPIPPTNVSASDGTYTDKVQVTWTASATATSYTVYRSSYPYTFYAASLGTTSGVVYDDTTATPGVVYYYWVKASNSFGTSNFSAYDTGSRSTGIPLPPTSVLASDGTYTDKVQVTWTASAMATSYTVYRASYPYTFYAASLGTTSGVVYDDTTATPGVVYYYWVKSSNSFGVSDFSTYNAGSR
jgi:cellulose 1,4-beta-cellobiosidase